MTPALGGGESWYHYKTFSMQILDILCLFFAYHCVLITIQNVKKARLNILKDENLQFLKDLELRRVNKQSNIKFLLNFYFKIDKHLDSIDKRWDRNALRAKYGRKLLTVKKAFFGTRGT